MNTIFFKDKWQMYRVKVKCRLAQFLCFPAGIKFLKSESSCRMQMARPGDELLSNVTKCHHRHVTGHHSNVTNRHKHVRKLPKSPVV